MTPKAFRCLINLCLLAAVVLISIAEGRQAEPGQAEALSGHGRSLAAAAQVPQCAWIAGEGCALHPSYVSYTLNRTSTDVTAQYMASALACANAVDKGACEADSRCFWDSAFTNGQQGCFLHDSALLALQQQCVQPQNHNILSKLQACMAARRSCQCGSSSSASSSCQLRQQQLLASYGGSSKMCQSLLSCWLSTLNSSSFDLLQLVEVQLAVVQPKLQAMATAASGGSNNGDRRRLLQDLPSMSEPVYSDQLGGSAGDSGYVLELGQYSNSSAATEGTSSTSNALVGMPGGITDETGSPAGGQSPVEMPGGVPSGGSGTGDADGGMGNPQEDDLMLESGQQGTEGSPAGSPALASALSPVPSSPPPPSTGSGEGSPEFTGGNAPVGFWRCAASAAIKADATRKWADIDYNSMALTLATWIKVIQPMALIDWGVQVMECFKTETPLLVSGQAGDVSQPNKESMEFAIVALIRVFSAQADVFRTYLQADISARAGAALTALEALSQNICPGQLRLLLSKYSNSTAYNRDVLLQAAALVTDMQWFASDAYALATAEQEAVNRQQVFEGVVSYGEEMMRRCLYWLFHVQFQGPPAHLPGLSTTTAASTALVTAYDSLAAASLPAYVVATDAAAWQQQRDMLAEAAGWAASAAALSVPADGQLDYASRLGNAVNALAKGHVHNFWGTQVEHARTNAATVARKVALQDPNKQSVRWQLLRQQQLQLLMALQQQVAATVGGNSKRAIVDPLLLLSGPLWDAIAASGSYLLGGTDSDAAAQQLQLLDALKHSHQVALLIRQCKGSPAGLQPLSDAAAVAAGVPAVAGAACAQLNKVASEVSSSILPGAGDVLTQALLSAVSLQLSCNGLPVGQCNNTPGCAVALAAIVVPASSKPSGSSSVAAEQLLLKSGAAANMVLTCQASDAGLALSSMPNSTKSALAAGSACQHFLQMPSCKALDAAAACTGYAACRWEASSERSLVHSVAGHSSRRPAAATAEGVCSMDWMQVLSTGSDAAYALLSPIIDLCGGISDSATCSAQAMLITVDAQAGSNNSIAKMWIPALVVAAVLGIMLFGAAVFWRRRSATARRAAEEAMPAGSSGSKASSKRAKLGKDGKSKGKGTVKKKVKRAEPGSYQPDLMRDSFTDYMRAAPQQFENGVAIAKAAMAVGSLDAAAIVMADVAGARMPYPPQQQEQQRSDWSRYFSSSGSNGSVAAGHTTAAMPSMHPGAGHASHQQQAAHVSSGGGFEAAGHDLIDLSTEMTTRPAAAAAGYGAIPASAALWALHSQQQPSVFNAHGSQPYHQTGNMLYSNATGGQIWGGAPPATTAPNAVGIGSPVAGLNAGLSGGYLSGGLSGQVDLIDTGASLALTSSLGLVSSLPHRASLPYGSVDGHQLAVAVQGQQQCTMAGVAGAAEAIRPGGLGGLARISSGRGYGVTFAEGEGGSQGGTYGSRGGYGGSSSRADRDIEDGASTPTSSCCHDSVCTFTPGPSSSVGRPSSIISNSSWRIGNRAPAGAAGSAGGGSGAGGGTGGLGSALSGALSGALSRSSWSSAMSTDLLMGSQHSAALDS